LRESRFVGRNEREAPGPLTRRGNIARQSE
jgi:hypothetical protein